MGANGRRYAAFVEAPDATAKQPATVASDAAEEKTISARFAPRVSPRANLQRRLHRPRLAVGISARCACIGIAVLAVRQFDDTAPGHRTRVAYSIGD